MHTKRLIVVFAVSLLLLLSAGLLFEVTANWVPFPWEPITDRPTILIYSPTQDSVYPDEVILNFSVVTPDSYVSSTPEDGRINAGWIDKVTYTLDGNQTVMYTDQLENIGDELPKNLTFSLRLVNLELGTHVLTVAVDSTVNYYVGGYLGYLVTNRTSTSRSIILTVEQIQTPTPHSSPLPSPTPSASSSATITPNSNTSPSSIAESALPSPQNKSFLNSTTTIIIVVDLLVICASVFLVSALAEKRR
ncbi:MAG: hypothetical protein NWF05_11100 [Candidatus Bathyarchaeota archaeon]|nr:hypothetical protein [Candidatus Bathyarchaeota archaeon]